MSQGKDREDLPGDLKKAMESAITWLTETAMVRNEDDLDFCTRYRYARWRGAIRSFYYAASREWSMFGPIWHTGQAVKALVLASRALKRPELLCHAEICAGFILGNRITEGEDKGLILAFEDHADQVNVSAILEGLDGLFLLSEATGKRIYGECAADALRWVKNHAWVPEKGHFNDIYNPETRRFDFESRCHQGRPLLDDAVFVKGWEMTGENGFREVAVQTAETLLRDENPAGNWIRYIPCRIREGLIHPRHAYWWGMPMQELFRITGEKRYCACFLRGAEWYRHALRSDGGFIRGTHADFNADSFGHATSGSACAAIYFMKTRAETLLPLAERALRFCIRMQFTHPADPNLKGAILEKIVPPAGTDASPYQVKDLGTIFFLQAGALYLMEHGNGK